MPWSREAIRLIGLAAVAGALALAVPRPARPQTVLRRSLTEQESLDLRLLRAKARRSIDTCWPGLDPEEAARLAAAYPSQWTTSDRTQ